jgi:hypothetical protein
VASVGADADGAGGNGDSGHLGERPVGADPVADDLGQAVGQNVRVVLVGADALLVRRRLRVVLDQCAAECGEGAVGPAFSLRPTTKVSMVFEPFR